mgnify:CR=1 FL=1
MPRLALLNPNANPQTTDMMRAIAQETAPDMSIQGITAGTGPLIIETGAALAASVSDVLGSALALAGFDGVIVSAFGDPGVTQLQEMLSIPVIGIGAASARAAARDGGRFGVVTTTPGLVPGIDALMRAHAGTATYAGTVLTEGDAVPLMADPDRLNEALLCAIHHAVLVGMDRVIIGGGPLGRAAERLRARSPVPLINPVRAAVLEMTDRLNRIGTPA